MTDLHPNITNNRLNYGLSKLNMKHSKQNHEKLITAVKTSKLFNCYEEKPEAGFCCANICMSPNEMNDKVTARLESLDNPKTNKPKVGL